jgi:restriction system protein
MSRRSKTSPIEDLIEAIAWFPWWVGVAFALVSYLLLHYFAIRPLPALADIRDTGAVFASLSKGAAIAGQYVLPLVGIAGAIFSAITRYKRRGLVDRVAHAKSTGVLGEMTWQEFERLVAEGFKLEGYGVSERGGRTADGGIDLALRKGNEKALVQCKHWRATNVPVQTVRELFGVMHAEGATHGFVVTSGDFTSDAREFAQGRNIELIDGARSLAMFNAVRAAVGTATMPATPSCPQCNKPMTKRTAKRGPDGGRAFWGCPGFPACRGTRPT